MKIANGCFGVFLTIAISSLGYLFFGVSGALFIGAIGGVIVFSVLQKFTKEISDIPNQGFRLLNNIKFKTIAQPFPAEVKYCDMQGVTTKRLVLVKGINLPYFILVYCTLRNEERTFRIENIKEMVDAETGEVILNIKEYILTKSNNGTIKN